MTTNNTGDSIDKKCQENNEIKFGGNAYDELICSGSTD